MNTKHSIVVCPKSLAARSRLRPDMMLPASSIAMGNCTPSKETDSAIDLISFSSPPVLESSRILPISTRVTARALAGFDVRLAVALVVVLRSA